MNDAAFLRNRTVRLILAWLLPFPVCVVQWILWDKLQPVVWFFFFLVVSVAPLIGGLWGGIGATLISALLAWYFFVPPQLSFGYENPGSIISLLVFIGAGVVMSIFQERLRQSEQKLERDIAERKATEQRLRESEERFRLVVENSPSPIGIWDETGLLRYISPAIEPVFGFSPDEMVRRAAYVYALADELEGVQLTPELMAQYGLSHMPNSAKWLTMMKTVQYCARNPGEKVVADELMFSQVSGLRDLQFIHQGFARRASGSEVVTIVYDLTEHRTLERMLTESNAALEDQVAVRTVELTAALERLAQANQAKDEFMAAVSHELRTPLTGVLGLSEALQEQIIGPLNERQLRYVRSIRESGDHLLTLVNSILHYTALVGGNVTIRHERCNLGEIASTAVRTIRVSAEKKGLAVALDVDPPDLTVISDAGVFTKC
ncbi:MAG: DUF4118 domain-containing protein [Anaerolineales bacterium]|nr:DUF4118 domain-containing protein [Anaerolineales bacterium]